MSNQSTLLYFSSYIHAHFYRRSFSQQSSSTGAAPPPPIQPPPVSHLRQLRLIIQWTIILSVIDITVSSKGRTTPTTHLLSCVYATTTIMSNLFLLLYLQHTVD